MKFNTNNPTLRSRIEKVELTQLGEATVTCKCGIVRIVRSRPPGNTGGLPGAMKQVMDQHIPTCNASANGPTTDAAPTYPVRAHPLAPA